MAEADFNFERFESLRRDAVNPPEQQHIIHGRSRAEGKPVSLVVQIRDTISLTHDQGSAMRCAAPGERETLRDNRELSWREGGAGDARGGSPPNPDDAQVMT